MKARKTRTKGDITQVGLEKRYDDKDFCHPFVILPHASDVQEVHLLESQRIYGLNSPLKLRGPTKIS